MTTDPEALALNSPAYWDRRFADDWDSNGGPQQTSFFADLALSMLPEWLLKEVRGSKLSVHDLGCAEGSALPVLAREFPHSKLSGSDVAAVAIATAKARHSGYSFSVITDATPAPDCDVVFCSNTIEHLEDWRSKLDAFVAPRTRHLIVLAPFRENELLKGKEHVAFFDADSFPPVVAGRLKLSHLAVRRTTELKGSRWVGQQFLAVWSAETSAGTSDGGVSAPDAHCLDLRQVSVASLAQALSLTRPLFAAIEQADEAKAKADFERVERENEFIRTRVERDNEFVRTRVGLENALHTKTYELEQAERNVERNVERFNATLAARERSLQVSFDTLRQNFNKVLSMRSFQYMMKGLQTYAQVRGKVIALPPAPERMTVRIERIGKGAMLSDSSPASIGRHRVIAPVARDATPLPPPSLPPTAAKQGDGAIDLSGFVRPERHLLQRARKAWRESFTFLCVAPFLPEFDHAALLSSFADVHAAFPQARLRLIGPQTDAASHAKVLGDVEASSLGHAIEMHFYDGPHGLSRHLAAVQAYVLPTVRAQPDPSIIHAAYFGLPMVLIDAAESRAAIQGGACGILVPPPASEAALGEAMKRIMSDYEALMDRGFEGQAWAEAQASGHHEATTTTRVGTSGTTSPQ